MKRLFFVITLILLIMALSHTSQAKVTGGCYNCHTMHNSQAGGPMAQTLTSSPSWGFTDDTTPNPSLLTYSCVGCHTNVDSGATIVNNVPIVFNPGGTITDPLAGGNFYYVVTDGDDRGHNVNEIKAQDGTLGLTPPGGTALSSQLTCAGEYGCHGDRTAGNDEVDGIKGAHHTDDSAPLTGASVGLSYRLLNGILGKEDSDWEQDNINTSHNEYKGSTSSTTNTISYLCATCHGKFHTWQGGATEVGTDSPWLRHPTDILLKNEGEYASYTTYSMTAPVARPSPDSVADTTAVTPGTDIIMCLSCHRTHGSPYYKMTRWDYKSWPGGGTNGCAVCHTWKQ